MVTEYASWSTLNPRPSLYEGIFAVEYLLRMSTLTQVKFVGMHELLDDWGIQTADTHQSDVINAFNIGKTMNTSNLNFGFYASAQILATAVANGVFKYATKLDKTTTQDSQSVSTAAGDYMPAIYAQAYEDNSGKLYLIVTNKGFTSEVVNITVNGTTPSGTYPLTFVAGDDPSATNTASEPNNVAIQFQTTQIPVSIPAYSVVRLDLTPPSPTSVNLVSAANGQAPLAAESIAAAYGGGLSGGTNSAPILPLPMNLQSTSVQVLDSAGIVRSAPLFYVSPTQINFQVPAGTAPGVATVNVFSGSAKVASSTVPVQNVSPSLFTTNSTGHGIAAALAVRVSSNGQQTSVPVFKCSNGSCVTVPIDVSGDTVFLLLYGTGIRHRSALAGVTCAVKGTSAQVAYAGPQGHYAGLDQVNVQLPKSLQGSGQSDVVLTTDGQASNAVQINIQ
jgi:uncharacterized protein (TIGR03437 family)